MTAHGDLVCHGDLKIFVELLHLWQRTHNLVARGELDEIWTRHVADSLQLLDHAGTFTRWLDLGSGAGFPGLVIAIAVKADTGRHVTLVESNVKKAAFLRGAIHATGARATVAAARIESLDPARGWDVISARALAPLPRLLALAMPLMGPATTLLLLKGRNFPAEMAEAQLTWRFDVLTHSSRTDSEGVVAIIRNVALRDRGP